NTDGDLDGVWTAIQTYTSDQGSPTNFATVTINLSAYINQPNLRVRFRYYSGWNYGWNVDDIRITGTSVPSPVAWTPIAGLYTDSALTIPYTGGNIATVYAYPDAAQTFTATVTNGSGCQATDTAVISGSSNIWNGTSWSSGTAPVAGTEKIIFNGNYSSTGDISGCLLQVNSGNVVINADNTVTVANQVRINPAATFTLEDTASLLQTAGTTNTNIGIIRSKRRTQPVKRLDFTYWSSPVAGQTLHNLSPATMADKYYSWNPVSQAWVTHMNGNVTMTDAKGYIVRAPQSFSTTSAVQYEAIFQGVPNNGDISIPVYGNTSTLPADYKWNLIGNPYPSAVDLDEFLSYANNVAALDGTIYLWTHNSAPSNAVPGDQTYNYTANDYATYNLSGGVATSPATPDPLNPEISDNFNGAIPTKHLASGQAFFVRGLGNLPARFTNDMRIQDENNRFFRNMNPVKRNAANSGIEKNRFWLNLRNNQGAFNQTLVGYIEGATNGLDRGFDGSLFGGNHVTIYSINDSQKLAIQGRALPFDNSDVVNLGIKTTIAGAFTISLDMLDGLFVNQDIYLKDNLQNAIHNLKSGPYSFTTGIGTFENRFQIVYRNEALGIPEFNPESIVIYKKDKDVVVTSGTATIEGVKVFDIQGRLLFDGQKINASEKVIKSLPPTDQVLIVQVVTTEGIRISRKILY
ncbi:MAG: T9SS sorting signal type C domain-containing protein, partial [Flavobacterium sp.]|nr:T9SS sorting signal type C domain-containing protein [Flavobacterium sp.]